MKGTWVFGAWKVKLDARLASGWGYWGLGFGAGVFSWRNLYPWLQGSLWVGPFVFAVDLTRPPKPAPGRVYAKREDDFTGNPTGWEIDPTSVVLQHDRCKRVGIIYRGSGKEPRPEAIPIYTDYQHVTGRPYVLDEIMRCDACGDAVRLKLTGGLTTVTQKLARPGDGHTGSSGL